MDRLEHALRNFSALTQGDIVEISYNSIVFDFLIMEAEPGGDGINIIDTDLEVDFAPPVGYKEPERPKAAPPPTMASKLKIDLASSSPGSSRPPSSLSGAFAGTSTGETTLSKGGENWESFKGKGETLGGRKTKGRGISQKGVEVVENSKVYRTEYAFPAFLPKRRRADSFCDIFIYSKKRIVTNDTLETDAVVPAPLNLPHGKLFFGFRTIPYSVQPDQAPNGTPASGSREPSSAAFSGGGNTLSGRSNPSATATNSKGKGKEKAEDNGNDNTSNARWGGGQTLRSASRRATNDGPVGAGGARVPRPSGRNGKAKAREPSPIPDWGVDSDEEVIYVDSD